MKISKRYSIVALLTLAGLLATACNDSSVDAQKTFRYDTFGDEKHWTGTLKWNEVVTTITPKVALEVAGLKVDSEVLPEGLLASADLNDPATTLALLKLDAIVGVKATVEDNGTVSNFGITCALCHSTVDDSVAPGIGKRLDGWPAKDLNPGLLISLSSYFDDKPTKRAELQSWGKGMFDPFWNIDNISDPVNIPPAYGFKDLEVATYTGEGDISFWNAYVATFEMGGQGTFSSDSLGVSTTANPDLVTSKLPALKRYQHSLEAPKAPAGSFDEEQAKRGKVLFDGKATCITCHSGKDFTDEKSYAPEVTGSDPAYAQRGSKKGTYRTTPLKGIWSRAPYFHDASLKTLMEVVNHYDSHFNSDLTTTEKADLVEYLKSI